MADQKAEKTKKRPSPRDLWRLVLVVVGAIAIIQELRKPAAERTWTGKVGVFPYDFRKPSADRFREAYWNPGGPILSSRPLGVGWTVNFGAVKDYIDSKR